MIVVHSYLTDGFFDMACVFLESFSNYHVNEKVVLTTRGLMQTQIEELQGLWKPLVIEEIPIDFEEMSERSGYSVGELLGFKDHIEREYISYGTRAWKLMIAGEDRIDRIYKILLSSYLADGRIEGMVHFDIDTLFRGNIHELIKLVASRDLGLKLRPNHKVVKARITIDCMTINNNYRTREFFRTWLELVRKVHPKERPVGFGQTTCWGAYEHLKHGMDTQRLPLKFGLPGRNANKDVIWCGNVHKLKKDDCVTMFRNEMRRLKEAGEGHA